MSTAVSKFLLDLFKKIDAHRRYALLAERIGGGRQCQAAWETSGRVVPAGRSPSILIAQEQLHSTAQMVADAHEDLAEFVLAAAVRARSRIFLSLGPSVHFLP
jgi:hypothetical protein